MIKKENKPNPCSCVQKFMIRIYYRLYLILAKCLVFGFFLASLGLPMVVL